jgi:hypothetical protein
LEDERYFHGREREIRDLISLLAGYRLVLLHAQSGAGKSSLVAAGLQPRLEAGAAAAAHVPPKLRGIRVLVARVSGVSSQDFKAEEGATNIYTHNVLLSVRAHDEGAAISRGATLASHLPGKPEELPPVEHGESEDEEAATPRDKPLLLILDQFEEILTAYPDRWREHDTFFLELGALLAARPRIRILLVAREEHLAQLERFGEHLPDGFRVRYRLDRLREKQALEAIIQPAENAVEVARQHGDSNIADLERACQSMKKAAPALIRSLQKAPLEVKAGRTIEFEGEFVEPLHLQVVCREAWWKLLSARGGQGRYSPEVTTDVDEVLANFYEQALAKIASRSSRARWLDRAGNLTVLLRQVNSFLGVPARLTSKLFKIPGLHAWVARELITPMGTRSQVYLDAGSGTAAGLPQEILNSLEQEHIVRKEMRAGTAWYELTHDRFVFAVRRVERSRMERQQRVLAVFVWGALAIGAGILLTFWLAARQARERADEAVQTVEAIATQQDRAAQSAAHVARQGLEAHRKGDPLARELLQQAQREDAWAGLMAVEDYMRKSDSPEGRSAYAEYMASLGPYLKGDVVNPKLRDYACDHPALVVGATDRITDAEQELERFRSRGFRFAELSEPVGRRQRIYVERFVSCDRARELIKQVNSTFSTDAFVVNAFEGTCRGCPDLPQSNWRRQPARETYSPAAMRAVLAGVKVGIYYDKAYPQLEQRAKTVQESLRREGFPGSVGLYPNARGVLDSLSRAFTDQVRYDAPAEEEAAEALVQLLQRADPGRKYDKLRSYSDTRDFLSVFLAN